MTQTIGNVGLVAQNTFSKGLKDGGMHGHEGALVKGVGVGTQMKT